MHVCLVPLTPYLAGIFRYLKKKGKIPPRVRAMDMRHILLVMPFLLEGLLTEEVDEHNRKNPFNPVIDPSPELVDITMLLISWYHLYRRRNPPKDEDDIRDFARPQFTVYFDIFCVIYTYFAYFHFALK